MPNLLPRVCLAGLLLLSSCSPRKPAPTAPPEPAGPIPVEHYDCYAIGRLQGTMIQHSPLGDALPAFAEPIRSGWLLAWSSQWTAEVSREDEPARVVSRTFAHARSVELIFPADLGKPRQTADPTLSPTVVSLASRLVALQPEGLEDEASSVLLQSESFDLSEVFALIGVDASSLGDREISVDATGSVLRNLEGETISAADGGVGSAWLFGEVLWGPTDDHLFLTGGAYADILPGVLVRDLVGGKKASFEMEVTGATVGRDGHVAGKKRAHLSLLPGGVPRDLEGVVLALGQDLPYVRQLRFSADVPGKILQRNPRFTNVTWEGNLGLDVLYVAERVPPI